MTLETRLLAPADHDEWLRMRRALWPHHASEEKDADADAWLARSDAAVIVASRSTSGLAGFVEVGARPYADGCATSPVGFLEGWYVDPDQRRRGVGTELVRAAERWSRACGYREFASDALLDNTGSQSAHRALGFEEVERSVKYRKDLD